MKHIKLETREFLRTDLWRLFPVINVDHVKDIPTDYPGAMGVPITFLDKCNRERWEILGLVRPTIGGRNLYRRLEIRNLKPDLPEVIDLTEWLEKVGSNYEITVED